MNKITRVLIANRREIAVRIRCYAGYPLPDPTAGLCDGKNNIRSVEELISGSPSRIRLDSSPIEEKV